MFWWSEVGRTGLMAWLMTGFDNAGIESWGLASELLRCYYYYYHHHHCYCYYCSCNWVPVLKMYGRLEVDGERLAPAFYRVADKSLARPGRKQANVSVRMAWISFGALLCRGKKKTWWQFASRCCWNRTRPWHASELVSFLVGLKTCQPPGTNGEISQPPNT